MRAATMCILALLLSPVVYPAIGRELVGPSCGRGFAQAALTTSYIPHDPVVVRSNAEFASQGWPGSGTENDPYLIEGLNISTSACCVNISNTDVHFVVRDCLLTTDPLFPGVRDGEDGVYFSNVTCGSIVDSVFDRKYFGVEIENSSHCEVARCVFGRNTWSGIRVDNSTRCSVAHNLVYDSSYSGIWIRHSIDCTVLANRVYDCSFGVIISVSVNCIVTNCTLFRNDYGVRFRSEGCLAVNNTCYANSEWGVVIVMNESTSNSLYQNRIGWNGLGNAVDNGTSNSWDDGIVFGNDWSDYDGGDTYQISGSSGSTDRYPSEFVDLIAPSIDHPPDIQYVNGTVGVSIEWSSSDQYPASYEVLRDGIVKESGTWDGLKVEIDVSNLAPGVYNYTLRVFDGAGNLAEDSILVQVVPTWSEILASGWGIVLALVMVIGFVAVSWKWKRKDA